MDEFIDVYLGEPVGENLNLFRKKFDDRVFGEKELSDFLSDCENELDSVVERLEGDEFSMMFYDIGLYRADNGRKIGGILKGGADFMGKKEKRFSLSDFKGENGYRGLFKKVLKKHDFSVPVNADMSLGVVRDKITKPLKARNPSYKD